MLTGIDILENELVRQYPDVLDILIRDHTTQENIFWATNDYERLGDNYGYYSSLSPKLITGDYGSIIMPRVHKTKILQWSRSKEMAEIFTPSWICNAQNNLVDSVWFGKENTFNFETTNPDGSKSWKVNLQKIKFPAGKTWKHYVNDNRLEIACGEAPYITSRYDGTTGDFIPIEQRVGILDRKLRVINENVNLSSEWLKAAQAAYKSTYAFEWQGDSLLLAREAMLATFIENYREKFNKEPLLKSVKYIAYIISWNVWQMDGLKGVVPNSCGNKEEVSENLFGDAETKITMCEGCAKGNINKHNGIYCLIKDWCSIDKQTGKRGKKIRFIDLLNGQVK